MEEKILLAELTKNCEGKKEKLMGLLKTFELACLGYDLQEQRCKDVYNRILAENEFYAAKDGKRLGVRIGDRITDERHDFLLSDEEWDRLQSLVQPALVEEGITDKDGYYIERWSTIRGKARRELVDFLLDEIVPKTLRMNLEICRNSIVWQDKLIGAMKASLRPAA